MYPTTTTDGKTIHYILGKMTGDVTTIINSNKGGINMKKITITEDELYKIASMVIGALRKEKAISERTARKLVEFTSDLGANLFDNVVLKEPE